MSWAQRPHRAARLKNNCLGIWFESFYLNFLKCLRLYHDLCDYMLWGVYIAMCVMSLFLYRLGMCSIYWRGLGMTGTVERTPELVALETFRLALSLLLNLYLSLSSCVRRMWEIFYDIELLERCAHAQECQSALSIWRTPGKHGGGEEQAIDEGQKRLEEEDVSESGKKEVIWSFWKMKMTYIEPGWLGWDWIVIWFPDVCMPRYECRIPFTVWTLSLRRTGMMWRLQLPFRPEILGKPLSQEHRERVRSCIQQSFIK